MVLPPPGNAPEAIAAQATDRNLLAEEEEEELLRLAWTWVHLWAWMVFPQARALTVLTYLWDTGPPSTTTLAVRRTR